jgi:carbon storage regulator
MINLKPPGVSDWREDFMLVITRKKGESILLGDDIEITVVKVDEGSVKLSISAPKSVTILRKELYKEVEEENKHAMIFDQDIIGKIK